jgi:SM-20-related protein
LVQPDFLARFGIFVAHDFLDDETCTRVRREMHEGGSEPATVGPAARQPEEGVDEEYRRTRMAQVRPATVSLIEDKLLALRPALEEHFSLALNGCQRPQFLVYRQGDFFRAHLDNSEDPDAPDWLKGRAVSLVVFIGEQSDWPLPDTFGGGALTFYGLLGDDPRGSGIGLPVEGHAGMLVAFRSEIVHGVTPVTRGERCTVVSWFSLDEA